MSRSITRRQRLRYWFDNTMARGPASLIGWLFVVSAVTITALAGMVVFAGVGPDHSTFADDEWAALLHALDTGTIANDNGWPFRFAMLAVTIVGIFLVSTLIGILTTGLGARLERLRRGRSFVAEEGHTVIVGWSSQIHTIVSELVLANANQPRSCIAILADRDAAEMHDEIRQRLPHTGRTRLVFRTGSTVELADVELVNPHGARSIIILPPEGDDPDAHVIKTILAITNDPHRREAPYHIVSVIRDPRNHEVARMVGAGQAELVLAGDVIARVTAQTCRQSGLSVAYTELMDFGGDEIYFKHEPALAGKRFAEALMAYDDSAVIGIRFADARIVLNPPMDTRLGADDRIIAISEDDDTIHLSNVRDRQIDEGAIRVARPREKAPERTLILGWNERASAIIGELDAYVGPGSTVLVVGDGDEVAQAREDAGRLGDRQLANLAVTLRRGDTTDRRTLDALEVDTYDHIIVLSGADGVAVAGPDAAQRADARTLITLLHLRDIQDRLGHDFAIVSEMLDIRNRELAQVTRADDFIVSDNLVSLLLSQISENRELAIVFRELFDPAGSEIYLKPASDFVEPGRPVNFYTVVESAARQGQVAIGYRIQAHAQDPAKSFG
ncbi:MAG: potassium transporter TrkA, partial [Gemmatimonadetes bacterium]|nr:potassium transporter TrkA [Gemmatimonadota bacterium]